MKDKDYGTKYLLDTYELENKYFIIYQKLKIIYYL